MLGQEAQRSRTWARPSRRGRGRIRRSWAIPRVDLRARLDPRGWSVGWSVAAAIGALALACLVYLSQVNTGSWLELRLLHQSTVQTELNAQRAQLLARLDALRSEYRVGKIVTKRFHMTQASLDAALWLKVNVPPGVPQRPIEPQVQTGPASWLSSVVHGVETSL